MVSLNSILCAGVKWVHTLLLLVPFPQPVLSPAEQLVMLRWLAAQEVWHGLKVLHPSMDEGQPDSHLPDTRVHCSYQQGPQTDVGPLGFHPLTN